MTRWLKRTGAAIAGVVAGVVVIGAIAAFVTPSENGGGPIVVTPRPDTQFKRVDGRTSGRLLLAWSPTTTGGLPSHAGRFVSEVRGVDRAIVSEASLDWLERSSNADGTVLDAPPRNLVIPIEAMAVRPHAYSAFVPPSDRAAVEGLGPGEALLSETAARLRHAGPGATLSLRSGRYKVTGVVSDYSARGYEVVLGRVPSSWEIVDRFTLIQLGPQGSRRRIASQLRDALPSGAVLRVRAKGETPFLRYGDAVVPEQTIKEAFGEYAGRPLPDGTIAIDPQWVETNIVHADVPVLGDVYCHRALIPQLKRAMSEVRRRGLSFLIDRSQFGGCFGPRFIGRVPGGRLSHHAWGIAIDINAADNAYGTRPSMDPRLVDIMERFGFTWGGRWLVPDGMHFEWVRFP